MAKSIEEILVLKIEAGIRGIRMGTKQPEDVKLNSFYDRLEKVNPEMSQELLGRYAKAVKSRE